MPRFTAKVDKPGEVEITISATMTLEEWRGVARVLADGEYRYDRAAFANKITQTVAKVTNNVELEELPG